MRELIIYIYKKFSELFVFLSNYQLETVSVAISFIFCVNFIYYFKNDIDNFIGIINDRFLNFFGVTNPIVAISTYYTIGFLTYTLSIGILATSVYIGLHTMFPKFGGNSDKSDNSVHEHEETKEEYFKRNFKFASRNFQVHKKTRELHTKRIYSAILTESFNNRISDCYLACYVAELGRIALILKSSEISAKSIMYLRRNQEDIDAYVSATRNGQILAIEPNIYGKLSQINHLYLTTGSKNIIEKKHNLATAFELYLDLIY